MDVSPWADFVSGRLWWLLVGCWQCAITKVAISVGIFPPPSGFYFLFGWLKSSSNSDLELIFLQSGPSGS